MSPAVGPYNWDDLLPEQQDRLIASGWHPHGDGKSRRYSFYMCPECDGLTPDIDGREPHPAWPACSCSDAPKETQS